MHEEGIFRVSGIATQINEIGEIFAKNGLYFQRCAYKSVFFILIILYLFLNIETKRPDLSGVDCHAIAGAYKKFFRELPVPIFDPELFERLLQSKRRE